MWNEPLMLLLDDRTLDKQIPMDRHLLNQLSALGICGDQNADAKKTRAQLNVFLGQTLLIKYTIIHKIKFN
jgi:hypothetical protein